MKKFLLFSLATSVALSSFAGKKTSGFKAVAQEPHAVAKTTNTGDTVVLAHILSTDTINIYLAGTDSGYVTGTDAYGDKGYAERYDATDTFYSVIGIVARFTGTVNPATTKTVTFNAWSVGAQTLDTRYASGHIYNSGFPATSLASVVVPITALGIGSGTAADTTKAFFFPTATAANLRSFFVGYTINYTFAGLAGDTIGVVNTKDGERHIAYTTISGADTILNNVNATMYDDNTWHDNAFDNFGIGNHLFLFAIVKLGGPTAINGVTKNNFTLYGNYPNPATNETNIKFAVAQATEVTISVTDMAGRTVKTMKQNCAAGTHTVPVNTSDLASGEYLYLVNTAEGDGFASKFTIAK